MYKDSSVFSLSKKNEKKEKKNKIKVSSHGLVTITV